MTLVNMALTLKDLPLPPEGKTGWLWTEQSEPLPDKMPDGSDWPKISIVTPSYNQGQFIEETIRSVLLQGYPNLEYMIIDGCSTDNSQEIIQKYSNLITYYKSEKDNGQTDALNKGFTLSTGTVMGWLNSDDLLSKDALFKLALHYKPGLKWWTGNGIQILNNKVLEYPCFYQETTVSRSEILHARRILFQVSTFWSRELWEKSGSIIKPFELAMDYELWLRFSKYSPAVIIHHSIGLFRTHDAAKTGTEEGFISYLKECDKVRLDEYKNDRQLLIIRVVLIWFWARFTSSKRNGWRSWVGRRPIPYV